MAHMFVARMAGGCTALGAHSKSQPFFIFILKKMFRRNTFIALKIHNLSSRAPKIVKQILTCSINQDLQLGTIACCV